MFQAYYLIQQENGFFLKLNLHCHCSDNPATRTKNKILDDFVSMIETSALDQGAGRRAFLEDVINRCNQVWGGVQIEEAPTVSVEDATALIYNLDLSVNKYQENCNFF